MLLASIALIVLTALIGPMLVTIKRRGRLASQIKFEAWAYSATSLLYTLPLSIAVAAQLSGGDLSEQMPLFSPFIPYALIYTSGFLMAFYSTLIYLDQNPANLRLVPVPLSAKGLIKLLWVGFLLACIWMLFQLASQAGGIYGLILTGYGVTEYFIGQGHYAIAFEWLTALAMLFLAYGVIHKWRFGLLAPAAMIGFLLLIFLIMGRRAAVVTLGLATIFILFRVNIIKNIWPIFAIMILGFFALNWIGLIRGESYDSLLSAMEIIIKKSTSLQESGEISGGIFYTLTTGNFVVPFEVLPQLMRKMQSFSDFDFGTTIPKNISLVIPTVLYPERVIPLGNWYMTEFYGTTSLNEGRQFYFLGEAYKNFGPFGFLIWGPIMAYIFFKIFSQCTITPPVLAIQSLVFGSLLNIQATDTSGFIVAFSKGFGFIPLIMIFLLKFRNFLAKSYNEKSSHSH